MLTGLLGFALFCLLYYALWACWCKFAPSVLPPTSPRWVIKPNFWLFFFVTLFFLMIYRKASR